jgi:hypothetical protein
VFIGLCSAIPSVHNVSCHTLSLFLHLLLNFAAVF